MPERLCDHVFIIGLDGARGPAVRETATPHFDSLMAGGAVTYAAQTVVPTSSFPAWGAMLHGVGPDKHGINAENPSRSGTPWPSFVALANEHIPDCRCASFCWWEPINSKIIEPDCPCHRVSMPDHELVPAAAEYIVTHRPDIFFIQLDSVDHAGHREGYHSAAYLQQITATDTHLGIIGGAIDAAGILDESLVIVLSDHGGVEKGHGQDHPDCRTIVWAARGSSVDGNVDLDGRINIRDTAAVVANALALPQPSGWDARLPAGLFTR